MGRIVLEIPEQLSRLSFEILRTPLVRGAIQAAHQSQQTIVDAKNRRKSPLGDRDFRNLRMNSLEIPERDCSPGEHEQENARKSQPQPQLDSQIVQNA